jgi:dTMP kinase
MATRGTLVVITGGNGTGKDTISPLLATRLTADGMPTKPIYGPGMSDTTRALQRLIFHPKDRPKSPYAMALTYYAVHAEAASLIEQDLEAGISVVLNRGPETTWLYNVLMAGLDGYPELRTIFDQLLGQLKPLATLLLDAPVTTTLARANQQQTTDQWQQEDLRKHERRRQNYLKLAKTEIGWHVIDASGPIDEVVGLAYRKIVGILALTKDEGRS